jgi:hypothetical protein
MCRCRHARPMQLPSAHADVALSALRDTPGRDGTLLGLPSIEHRLRIVPPLPALGCRPDRLLRARPPAPAAPRRRDTGMLGIARPVRDGLTPQSGARGGLGAGARRGSNDRSVARLHRGSSRGRPRRRRWPGTGLSPRRVSRRARCIAPGADRRVALEPVGRRRGLIGPGVRCGTAMRGACPESGIRRSRSESHLQGYVLAVTQHVDADRVARREL